MAHRYLPLPDFHRLDWQPYGLRAKDAKCAEPENHSPLVRFLGVCCLWFSARSVHFPFWFFVLSAFFAVKFFFSEKTPSFPSRRGLSPRAPRPNRSNRRARPV